jgi:hypothetical protein
MLMDSGAMYCGEVLAAPAAASMEAGQAARSRLLSCTSKDTIGTEARMCQDDGAGCGGALRRSGSLSVAAWRQEVVVPLGLVQSYLTISGKGHVATTPKERGIPHCLSSPCKGGCMQANSYS